MLVAELRCAELEQQRRADSKRLSAAAAEKDKLQEKYYTDMVRQLVMQLGHRTFKPHAWDDGLWRTPSAACWWWCTMTASCCMLSMTIAALGLGSDPVES